MINGSEKCLIAQEKMSNNHVYVFEKRMPCKYSYTAECRCVPTAVLTAGWFARRACRLHC